MTKKTRYLLGIAGSVLAAGSLYATDYNETFESGKGAWTDGTPFATNYPYAGVAGKPLAEVNPNHVLVIEGDSSYDASTGGFTGSPMVDMMVQAALPDDGLETPEEGAHIAVAVDTNGIFNVYCKNKSGTAADWYPLSSTVYADGAWARVSLLFDYTNGRCQIRLDGQPMMTTNGFLTATSSEVSSAGNKGAWYTLATTGSSVSNLKVVGCTAVDDVVIAANATGYAIDSEAKANGVSCAWLDQYGLGWDTTASYDSSKKADGTTAMTVADKYKYCFDPFDGKGEADFAVKSISTTAEQVTLALPDTVVTAGRKVVVDYGSDKTFAAGTYLTTEEVTDEPTVQISVPASGSVTYYRLRATDK